MFTVFRTRDRQVDCNSLIQSDIILMGMCFLSVYRLKYLISIGTVVTLCIGIALLYVLVYSFIISSVTIQVQTSFRTVLISGFLSTSLLMVLSSLSGIYGLIRKKNKFVAFYAVTMGLYMISFMILGIGTAATQQYITSQCGSGQISDYQATFLIGQSMLCKQNCECYFTNSQKYSDATIEQMGIINYNSTNSTLPINAQSCEEWANTTLNDDLSSQLSWLEMFFNCSGWCQDGPYYVFSNINYGVPSGNCYNSVSDFAATFGRNIMIASFIVGGFILILLVIICCLWLHPDRGLKYDSMQMFKQPLVFLQEQHHSQSQAR